MNKKDFKMNYGSLINYKGREYELIYIHTVEGEPNAYIFQATDNGLDDGRFMIPVNDFKIFIEEGLIIAA